jgi:dihydrofolate reductase
VDELRLKIYPVTLGKGKKLFENSAIPAAFTLTEFAIFYQTFHLFNCAPSFGRDIHNLSNNAQRLRLFFVFLLHNFDK